MASFGPQVKNMAQAGAGEGGEKAFADAKGNRTVHGRELFPFPVSPAQLADAEAPGSSEAPGFSAARDPLRLFL